MDIQKLGPGIWYIIHFTALRAKTEEEKVKFRKFIHELAKDFPCLRCRKHFSQYISDFPLERYWSGNEGLFIWSWQFHNSVNRRLKKPEMDYEKAKRIYEGSEVCEKCSEEEITESVIETLYEPVIQISYPKKKKKDQKIKFILRSFDG
ncbi:MAG: Erv1/Alr family FAD-linked sulfhydryl oxidase [Candidatus Aenigmatarchaeota archaeon]|jgi:hypothetical protein